jgi:cytochrome c oxidase cbb3-type subunit I/II
MPAYSWLYDSDLNTRLTQAKLNAFKTLGAPYSDEEIEKAVANLESQAKKITDELVAQGVEYDEGLERKEIIALIAYLQRLGTDIKVGG